MSRKAWASLARGWDAVSRAQHEEVARQLLPASQKSTESPVLASVGGAVARNKKVCAGAAGAPTRSKYRAVKTGGYASKREAKRAAELKLLQKAGQIRNLREQVRYELIPKQEGERALTYVADFVYEEPSVERDGMRPLNPWSIVVEDCKGYRTPEYRIKRKLMLYLLGIRLRET